MLINLEFDRNALAASLSFRQTVQAAADLIDATFSDPITLNISVGYGEINGSALSNGSAQAQTYNAGLFSYSATRAALAGQLAPEVQSGVAALPTGAAMQGATQVLIWSAEEKALGLIAANASALDGMIGFAADVPSNLLLGVAFHELTHAMGRLAYDGSFPDVLDLYRFTSVGQRLFNGGATPPGAYFSLDGGRTVLGDYSSDPGDFNGDSHTTNDPFNATYSSTTYQNFTHVDLLEMQALGFHLQPQGVAAAANGPARSDLDGDHYSDVLFQNLSSGDWGYAALNAGGYAWDSVGNAGAGFAVKAVGDLNGDGIADVVFQNSSTGQFGYTAMQSHGYTWVNVGNATAAYTVAGTGDFNGDGTTDILFQNHATGQFGYAAMHPGGYAWVNAGNSTAAYAVAGVGDFNGDGVADVLFQNAATGDWGYAAMHRGGYTWMHEGDAGAGYAIAGVGDFNGDGLTDIIFRNAATGDWGYATVTASGYSWSHVGVFDRAYSIVATGDYNRDGITDVAFRNNATSDWGFVAMNDHGGTWYDMGASGAAFHAF